MIAFTFPPSKLRAVALFAAKNDIRYYLNGVHFCKAPNGAGMLAVATDGHRLTVIYHAQDVSTIPEDFNVIVPTAELVLAAKSPAKADKIALDCIVQVHDIVPGAGKPRGVVLKSAITVKASEIEGKFPAWQKIIPPKGERKQSTEPVGMNAGYVVDYQRAGLLLGHRNQELTISAADPNGAILVGIGDEDVVCVLMPMRVAGLPAAEWLNPKVAA